MLNQVSDFVKTITKLSAEDKTELKTICKYSLITKIGMLLLVFFLYTEDMSSTRAPAAVRANFNPKGYWWLDRLGGLMEYDGVHFFKGFLHGYNSINHFAFYPGYPYLLKFIDTITSFVPFYHSKLSQLGLGILRFLLHGFAINLVLHLANILLLFKLAKLKGLPMSQIRFFMMIFAVNGTSLFHVVLYSETLYLFITLLCMVYLEQRCFSKKQSVADLPWIEFILLSFVWSLSGWVRSLGMLSAAYLCYPILLEVIWNWRYKGSTVKILSYIMKILTCGVLFIIPTLSLHLYTRHKFCIKSQNDPNFKVPGFCKSPFGFFYGYIQEEFWGVRFLDWVKNPSHADTLVLVANSLPILTIWLWKELSSNLKGYLTFGIPAYLNTRDQHSRLARLVPEVCIYILLYRGFYMYANLGSIERFWTVHPHWYFLIAEFQSYANKKYEKSDGRVARIWWALAKWITVFSALFRIGPTALFYACRIIPI